MRKWGIAVLPAVALAGLAVLVATRPRTSIDPRPVPKPTVTPAPARTDPVVPPPAPKPPPPKPEPPPPPRPKAPEETRVRRWIDVRVEELIPGVEVTVGQRGQIEEILRAEREDLDKVHREADEWALEQAAGRDPVPAEIVVAAEQRREGETIAVRRETGRRVGAILNETQKAAARARQRPGAGDPFGE